jgi:hypothetical protein
MKYVLRSNPQVPGQAAVPGEPHPQQFHGMLASIGSSNVG